MFIGALYFIYLFYFIYFQLKPYKVGAIIISLLQIKKLSYRELKEFFSVIWLALEKTPSDFNVSTLDHYVLLSC